MWLPVLTLLIVSSLTELNLTCLFTVDHMTWMRLEWNHPFTLASHLTQLGFNPEHEEKGDFYIFMLLFCRDFPFKVFLNNVFCGFVWLDRQITSPRRTHNCKTGLSVYRCTGNKVYPWRGQKQNQYKHFSMKVWGIFHTQAFWKRKYHWKNTGDVFLLRLRLTGWRLTFWRRHKTWQQCDTSNAK